MTSVGVIYFLLYTTLISGSSWLKPTILKCWRLSLKIFMGKCSLLTLQLHLSCYYTIIWKCFWCLEWFKHIITHIHTHKNTLMKPHWEPLCCRSGRETKADRSERRYNQLWVLRKKHFAPSFQSSFTSSHLHSIFHHHRPLFHPPLGGARCGGWWCWHKQTQFRVWTDEPAAGVAQDPQRKLGAGAHVEALLRCRVQLKQKVYC